MIQTAQNQTISFYLKRKRMSKLVSELINHNINFRVTINLAGSANSMNMCYALFTDFGHGAKSVPIYIYSSSIRVTVTIPAQSLFVSQSIFL